MQIVFVCNLADGVGSVIRQTVFAASAVGQTNQTTLVQHVIHIVLAGKCVCGSHTCLFEHPVSGAVRSTGCAVSGQCAVVGLHIIFEAVLHGAHKGEVSLGSVDGGDGIGSNLSGFRCRSVVAVVSHLEEIVSQTALNQETAVFLLFQLNQIAGIGGCV